MILCDWFLPGYLAGGPIQSVANLTAHLKDEFIFKIITTDRDFKSDKTYEGIKVNEWVDYKGRQVFYLSPEMINPGFILTLIQSTPHDFIYLNGLYSKFFSVYPLRWKQQGKIKSNIILAPRGMLGDGALAVKAFKKKVYLNLAKSLGYFKGIIWQSSSTHETADIKNRISSNAQIFQISNLPAYSQQASKITKRKTELKLCFVARILDIKNLKFAVEVLKEIKQGSITFDIYGPIEDGIYWKACLKQSLDLPKNIQFNYKGILKPEEVGLAISNYHALFLPTRNENYGHVIVEALQHGRMVLISDQTPWRNLQQERAGYDIPLNDKMKFVEAIENLLEIDDEKFQERVIACHQFIHSKLDLENIKQQYISLFSL